MNKENNLGNTREKRPSTSKKSGMSKPVTFKHKPSKSPLNYFEDNYGR